MKDRVLTSQHGQFELREWDGKNRSGIQPVGDKVLVLVDPCCEKSGSIIIPDDQRDRQTLASTTGIMVAAGPKALASESGLAAGIRVCFERYAGNEYAGLDGELYRLMQDRSIGGTMDAGKRIAQAKAA